MAHREGYCDRCHQKLPPRLPASCLHCLKPLPATRIGRQPQYCDTVCKRAFETAARRYVIAQVRAGKLHPGDIQSYRTATKETRYEKSDERPR
jgi:hypothetical protein